MSHSTRFCRSIIGSLIALVSLMSFPLSTQAILDFPAPVAPEDFNGGWTKTDEGYTIWLNWEPGNSEYQSLVDEQVQVTGYNYYLKRSPAFSDGKEVVIEATGGQNGDTSVLSSLNAGGMYLDFDIEEGQTYTYELSAYSPWTGKESAVVTHTVPVTPDDFCPEFRIFPAQTDDPGQGQLIWTQPCGADQYKVEMKVMPITNGAMGKELSSNETVTGGGYSFSSIPGTYVVTVTAQAKASEGQEPTDIKAITKKFQINEPPKDPDFACTPPADPILGNPGGSPNGWPNGWHLPDFGEQSKKWAAALTEGTLPGDAIGGRVHKPYLYYPGRELWWPKYDASGEISVGPSGVIEYGTQVTASAPGEPTESFYPAHIGSWGLYGTGYLFSAAGYRMGFKPVFVKASENSEVRAAVSEGNTKLIGADPRDRLLYFSESRPANAGVLIMNNQTFSNGALLGAWKSGEIPSEYHKDFFALNSDLRRASSPQAINDPSGRAGLRGLAHTVDLIGPLKLRSARENGMCGRLAGPETINISTLDLQYEIKRYFFAPYYQQTVAQITLLAREVLHTGEMIPLKNRSLTVAPSSNIRALGTDFQKVSFEDKADELELTTDEKGKSTVFVRFSGSGELELADKKFPNSVEKVRFNRADSQASLVFATPDRQSLTTENSSLTMKVAAPITHGSNSFSSSKLTLILTPNFTPTPGNELKIRTMSEAGQAEELLSADAEGKVQVPLRAFGENTIQVEAPEGLLKDDGLQVANRHYDLIAHWEYADGTSEEYKQTVFLGSAPAIELSLVVDWPQGIDAAKPLLAAGTQVPLAYRAVRRITNAQGQQIEVPVEGLSLSLAAKGYRDALDPQPEGDLPWIPTQDAQKVRDDYYTSRTWQLNYINDLVFPELATSKVTTDADGEVHLIAQVPHDIYPSWAYPVSARKGVPMTIEVTAHDAAAVSDAAPVTSTLEIMTIDERLAYFSLMARADETILGGEGQVAAGLVLDTKAININGSPAGPFTAGANLDLQAQMSAPQRLLRSWSAQRLPEVLAASLGLTQEDVEATARADVVRVNNATDQDGRGTLGFRLSPGLRYPGTSLNLALGANKPGYLGRTQLGQAGSPTSSIRLQAPVALHLRAISRAETAGKLRVQTSLTTLYGDSIDWYFTERARYQGLEPEDVASQYTWLTDQQVDELDQNTDIEATTQPAMSRLTNRLVEFDFGSDVVTENNYLQAVVNVPETLGYPVGTSPTHTLVIDWSDDQRPTVTLPEGEPSDALADSASVTCSSEIAGRDVCFDNRRTSWVSGGGVDSWIEYTWDTPQIITGITLVNGTEKYFLEKTGQSLEVLQAGLAQENDSRRRVGWPLREYLGLFERNGSRYVRWTFSNKPTGIEQAALTFSDGSTINVGELPYAHQPLSLSFSPKTVTSVRFTVDATSDWLDPYYDSPSIGVVGLKEFMVSGYASESPATSSPEPSVSESPTATPSPTDLTPEPTPTSLE